MMKLTTSQMTAISINVAPIQRKRLGYISVPPNVGNERQGKAARPLLFFFAKGVTLLTVRSIALLGGLPYSLPKLPASARSYLNAVTSSEQRGWPTRSWPGPSPLRRERPMRGGLRLSATGTEPCDARMPPISLPRLAEADANKRA